MECVAGPLPLDPSSGVMADFSRLFGPWSGCLDGAWSGFLDGLLRRDQTCVRERTQMRVFVRGRGREAYIWGVSHWLSSAGVTITVFASGTTFAHG